jgi:hypothetical protein
MIGSNGTLLTNILGREMGVAGDSQAELFWNLKFIVKILEAIHRYIEYLLNCTKFFYVWKQCIFSFFYCTSYRCCFLKDKRQNSVFDFFKGFFIFFIAFSTIIK